MKKNIRSISRILLSKKIWAISVSLLFFQQFAMAQIAGPCGTTITVINASSPTATDGAIIVKGITGTDQHIYLGITGSEMYSEMLDVADTSQIIITGLKAGTYTVKADRDELGINVCALTPQAVVVGANSAVTCAGTEIGGSVFYDSNADGIQQAGEAGAATVTVKAYNAAGTLVNTQTTGANGSFKFTGLGAAQPYRLEYSWADSYIKSGALGSGSGSSVQFVNSGGCTANFGINYPDNYCQTANPFVMTPCYVNGDPQSASVAPLDVLVSFPAKTANSDWGVAGQNTAPTHVASASQIGSTWAIAYQKTTKYAFTGATMRRFSGFGPLGTGGIYKMDMTTPTSPVVSNWIDIKTLGINTGADTRDGTPANSLAITPATPAWDAEAFNQVGKVGIGGMDFNDRGDTLWLMSLGDRKLYGIKNVNPATTPTAADVIGGYAVSLPAGYACASDPNDLRPWAVKYYKGLVYVGVLCSGEATPWQSFNLRGYVLSFNPANPGAGFTYVTDFPLDYDRQYYQSLNTQFQTWLANSTVQSYVNQPIITDFEFDVDGSLIVAIGDRGGFQTGKQNYFADPTATKVDLEEGVSFGDILRFCKTGATYVQTGTTAGCANPAINPFSSDEFYWGETGPLTSVDKFFSEIMGNGLSLLPNDGAVLASVQDAYTWFSGGTIAFSNTSGGDLWRYVIYDNTTPGANGKAAGLGDIETLCNPAPIEIGNRVWKDTNNNGIQDAGETGIANVQLDLYQGATLVGSVTTDANGQYAFKNLLPNTAYQLRVNLTQTAVNTLPLATVNAGGNTLIDNNMTKSGSTGIINLTTGFYGDNNHTFDIGFQPFCSETVATVGSNNCEGSVATLKATGSTTGTYSWSGPNGFTSTSQNPVLTNVQTSFSGTYTVVFTADNGCTASNTAQLTVNPVLSITTQPASLTECLGGTQTLTVTTNGGFAPLNYQWQSADITGTVWTNIAGATAASYTPLSTTTGSTTYRVIISSPTGIGCNSVTSSSASVSVVNDPIVTITTLPTTVCIGANVTLTANTTGGAGTCTLQWESSPDGTTWTPIPGATNSTYNVINMTASTKYHALMNCTGNGCCN